MADRLPLATLLSGTLVAYTVELDNEFERQLSHRSATTHSPEGSRQGPWLASMVMWSTCMRYVSDDGVTVRELQRLARTSTNLGGMLRWGYIVAEPAPTGGGSSAFRPDMVLRPTAGGRRAQEVWRPLFDSIEQRWHTRFGAAAVDDLRRSLHGLADQLDDRLPECLPILGYGLSTKDRLLADAHRLRDGPRGSAVSELGLAALLARVLLAYAIEFERASVLSLALCANVVRVLDKTPTRVRDLPRLSGVSKEAIAMAMGVLSKRGRAVVDAEPGGRLKAARLSATGMAARDTYLRQLDDVEDRCQTRWGGENVAALRQALDQLTGGSIEQTSPLFGGLDPHPGGWRASVPQPRTLPHYPMVLHRGGYPDGA